MEIFKKENYSNYVLWIGDYINKKLNIPTKNELALTIYDELSEDIKKKVKDKERLTEVSQIFLDSTTGNMMNLISLLSNELALEGKPNPYTYLSEIDVIDTIITHDHSEILESIWENGEIHNVFCEKNVTKSNVNLFKILGDYSHTERIILTSQNMRKIKKLKLYDHFWEKLNGELKNKNLILLGVNLDADTKDILNLVFSKTNLSNTDKYFVTSNPISMEDESWLISNEFKFIYEDDLNFVKKMVLHFNNKNIDAVKSEIQKEENLVENIDEIQRIEIEENYKIKEKIKVGEKIKVEEDMSENYKKKQLKIFEEKKVKNLVTKNSSEIVGEPTEIESIEEKYIVENLEIPLYLNGNTLKGEIIETEVKNRQIRLVEFREKRSPSYKIDDFSDIDHYKALDIKIPFESDEFPQVKLENKIFSGKIDIRCNDQIIYGVAIKSHMSDKYQVIDFKNHNFTLKLLLEDEKVMNFAYKISENTVNIKGRNIYTFFKSLFSGFELNFRNKKINGNIKITSNEHVGNLDIILSTIDKYLSIKKQIKIRDINLKELLKNTRSLEVLFSYYNNTPKVTNGNITIRTNFLGDINQAEKLVLNYPISINFLGFTRSLIESTEIKIDSSNIIYTGDQLEIQVFNATQNTTYKKIIR